MKTVKILSKTHRNLWIQHCALLYRVRSIGHRSDTLITHVSNYKHHMILDNTILNKNNYISKSWIAIGYHLLSLS